MWGNWGNKISDFELLSLVPLSLRWIETTKKAFTVPILEDRNKLEKERLDLALGELKIIFYVQFIVIVLILRMLLNSILLAESLQTKVHA